MNRDRGTSSAGVSLVELLLVLAACAVLVGGLMSGIASVSTEAQQREERLLAVAACRNVLENLRRSDLETVVAAGGTGFAIAGVNGAATGLAARRDDDDGLPGSVAVTPERTYGTEVLYRVTVAVDWRGATPGGHVHLTTLMGRRR